MMATDVFSKEYKIPFGNLSSFENMILKINRKAAKLDFPEISTTLVRVVDEIVKKRHPSLDHDIYNHAVIRRFHLIKVTGQIPVYEGFSFLGTLDHTYSDSENLVKAVPGVEIPQNYWTAPAWCDHCQKARNRKESYIIRDSDGVYYQVGSSCLADFLPRSNMDPHAVASLCAELSALFSASTGGDQEFGGSYGGPHLINLKVYLQFVAATIIHFGWISRGKAREDITLFPTADRAMNYLEPPAPSFERHKDREERLMIVEEAHQLEDVVELALSWIKEQDTSQSAYLHNLKLVCSNEGIQKSEIGTAASLIFAFRNFEEKQKELERKKQNASDYLGVIDGGRQSFDVYVDYIKPIGTDSAFGTKFLHIMYDRYGNILNWFCSQEHAQLKVGHYYSITCGVSDHKEYEGVKQTYVKRVKAVEISSWNV